MGVMAESSKVCTWGGWTSFDYSDFWFDRVADVIDSFNTNDISIFEESYGLLCYSFQ